MTLLLRVRGFYLLKKQEKKTITRLLGLLRSQLQQIVADHKGNAFILEKIVKKLL